MDLKGLFKLSPTLAIKYLKKKHNKVSWDWYDIWQEAHNKSFTVAKAMREDILQDIFRENRILEMTTSIPFKPMDEITKSNNYGIHHVVAPIEKVKELILTNHKGYMNLRLKEKVIIVKHFAKFENDTDLLEFLEYMEEKED